MLLRLILFPLSFCPVQFWEGGGGGMLSKWLLSQEMESAIWVQILDEAVCISSCLDALEKGMNPSVLSLPSYGWWVG